MDTEKKKKNNYHIREEGAKISLCGKKTAGNELDLSLWGRKSFNWKDRQKLEEISSNYCEKCQKLYLTLKKGEEK